MQAITKRIVETSVKCDMQCLNWHVVSFNKASNVFLSHHHPFSKFDHLSGSISGYALLTEPTSGSAIKTVSGRCKGSIRIKMGPTILASLRVNQHPASFHYLDYVE